jgi:hypothetical protein
MTKEDKEVLEKLKGRGKRGEKGEKSAFQQWPEKKRVNQLFESNHRNAARIEN